MTLRGDTISPFSPAQEGLAAGPGGHFDAGRLDAAFNRALSLADGRQRQLFLTCALIRQAEDACCETRRIRCALQSLAIGMRAAAD